MSLPECEPRKNQMLTTHQNTIPTQSWALSEWRTPPSRPIARRGEVHVWRVSLIVSQTSKLEAILDRDELARADRFRFQKDRDRFIVARGALRTILAGYFQTRPAALRFSYSSYGKPTVGDALAAAALRFNLSHANELAVVAVTCGREIGIDIEHIRAEFAAGEIAERYFSRREILQLRALPADLQTEAFFNCWTRKEAYIKARGLGLSMPLDQFDVSLAPDAPAALLDNRLDEGEVSRWSFQELFPAPDYAAALAVEGGFSALRLWDFAGGAPVSLPA